MKLIESSVQIIEEKDPYKMIELAGRTCYKYDQVRAWSYTRTRYYLSYYC